MSTDCDVLVIGGGASGLSAAVAAAEEGGSVILLEAASRTGGSGALSGGVIYAAGTSVQKLRKVEDDADAMFQFYMAMNRWNLQPNIVRRMTEESGPLIEWLISLGIEFLPENLIVAGVDNVLRGHVATGSGAAIFEALTGIADARGVAIHPNIRVESLLDEGGRISGARAQGQAIRAGAVVLACGGFGANRRMLEQYVPQLAIGDDWWSYYVGTDSNNGDAINMGRAVGADIVGHGRMSPLKLSPKFSRNIADFHPAWLMMINSQGRRFMNETIHYSINGHLTAAQPSGVCHVIFDEVARSLADHNNPKAQLAARVGGDFVYTADRIAEEAKKGRVVVADSIALLAVKLGVDPVVLDEQIKNYNADVLQGRDSIFLKEGEMMQINTPPFYGVTLYPVTFGATCTGLRIDRDAQVLKSSGGTITGLFAAGEAAGGVIGDRYVASGNFLCSAMTFGRIAGGSAARFAASSAPGTAGASGYKK